MKKIALSLLSLAFLSACSSTPAKFSEEKGTACMDRMVMAGSKPDQVTCYPVRTFLDPTRFHKLSEWQKNNMPSMPDLN